MGARRSCVNCEGSRQSCGIDPHSLNCSRKRPGASFLVSVGLLKLARQWHRLPQREEVDHYQEGRLDKSGMSHLEISVGHELGDSPMDGDNPMDCPKANDSEGAID